MILKLPALTFTLFSVDYKLYALRFLLVLMLNSLGNNITGFSSHKHDFCSNSDDFCSYVDNLQIKQVNNHRSSRFYQNKPSRKVWSPHYLCRRMCRLKDYYRVGIEVSGFGMWRSFWKNCMNLSCFLWYKFKILAEDNWNIGLYCIVYSRILFWWSQNVWIMEFYSLYVEPKF